MTRILLGFTLALFLAGTSLAHNGITNFMPAWPDPSTFVLDGEEDDWGWYDTDNFGLKPEQFESANGQHFEQGPNPNPEDFSASFLMAWSPLPDNAIYAFARVQDDVLISKEIKYGWWNDEYLQLQADFDHGGGIYQDEQILGYRLGFTPIGSKDEGGQLPPHRDEDGGLFQWGGFPPVTYVQTTILPAGSTNLAENVEYTYEVRHTPYAIYSIHGPDDATLHINLPEQIVHFNPCFHDADIVDDAQTRQDMWTQVGNSWMCDHDGEVCPDYLLVPTDMVDPYPIWDDSDYAGPLGRHGHLMGQAGPTAVEATTWARIKSYVSE
jgi:hypothetical protein